MSGSRLRAMFYDGGGGALRLRGWFDSEGSRVGLFDSNADALCAPEPFADGLRCVPQRGTGQLEGAEFPAMHFGAVSTCASDRAADASWARVGASAVLSADTVTLATVSAGIIFGPLASGSVAGLPADWAD
ncbi:MAG: hypothetical protein ACRENE_23610 [Polyangiaceae bacterium]